MSYMVALLHLFVLIIGISKCYSIDKSSEVVGQWVQRGQNINGEGVNDYSGSYISMCGDGSRIAIGAVKNNENTGHVRIFGYQDGLWSQVGSDIDGETSGDLSGRVSMSATGDRVAIGATSNDDGGNYAGHVRVFEYTGTQWLQIGQDIDGRTPYEAFGLSVSMSADGDRVAIGGPSVGSGVVRIFDYDAVLRKWSQVGSDINGENASDQSGWSVSLSGYGSRVAIGAFQNTNGGGFRAGHVRIYGYKFGEWSQLGMDIDGENAGDRSGYAVSMSSTGHRVAIGADASDGINGKDTGHVSVYQFMPGGSGDEWRKVGENIEGSAEGDLSGFSVSISANGDMVAIGSYGHDGNTESSEGDMGQVRIFAYDGIRWTQIGEDILGERPGDQSGRSVALSSNGEWVAIGSHKHNGRGYRSGHVRVFEYVSSQQPTLTRTFLPSSPPSIIPTVEASFIPSRIPTFVPTKLPTLNPSNEPTVHPSSKKSRKPSSTPTIRPSLEPLTEPPSFVPSSLNLIKLPDGGELCKFFRRILG